MSVNIPCLLDLDLLTKFKIVINFNRNITRSTLDGPRLLVVWKLGHAYVERKISAIYTKTKLRCLHCHFITLRRNVLLRLLNFQAQPVGFPRFTLIWNRSRRRATFVSRKLICHIGSGLQFPVENAHLTRGITGYNETLRPVSAACCR